MTLKEIAKIAGVSASTVSRILNSPDNSFASKELRDRVWDIVKRTGYIPNIYAKQLKSGKNNTSEASYTFACILGRTKNYEDNPFFAQLERAIEHYALGMGCRVVASYSVFDLNNADWVNDINAAKADGAIILGRFSNESYNFFSKHYKNNIYIGRNVLNINIDQVICDGYESAKIAMLHLISIGHKSIAYIGETENEIRYKAYCDVISEYELDNRLDLIASSSQDSKGGYLGAEKILQNAKPLPTAIFCATDISAISVIKKFKEVNLDVPNDISIISIDDIDLAQYSSPMLTTVRIPKAEMAKTAVHKLRDRINKEHKLPVKIFIPSTLIVRESTKRLINKE